MLAYFISGARSFCKPNEWCRDSGTTIRLGNNEGFESHSTFTHTV